MRLGDSKVASPKFWAPLLSAVLISSAMVFSSIAMDLSRWGGASLRVDLSLSGHLSHPEREWNIDVVQGHQHWVRLLPVCIHGLKTENQGLPQQPLTNESCSWAC